MTTPWDLGRQAGTSRVQSQCDPSDSHLRNCNMSCLSPSTLSLVPSYFMPPPTFWRGTLSSLYIERPEVKP